MSTLTMPPRPLSWRAWRDRLLASPGFQRWAAAFPLTRPLARRRSRELFDLCAGFVYSQVLSACVRVDLFEQLRGGPRTTADLAPALALPENGARRLLEAAASLRLVEALAADTWALGVHGAALLANPGVSAMVRHHALLYADLADPVALLRGERAGALAGFWPYRTGADSAPHAAHGADSATNAAPAAAPPDPAAVAAYTALMATSQQLVADEILDAVPLSGTRVLLDVGGGDGSFLARAAARWPHLAVHLFDLPPVAAHASARFQAEGLGIRARVTGGDFRRDPLPADADTLSLVRVAHDHDDASVAALLAAAFAALPAGGRLILAEPMAGVAGAEPVGAAYFGFYLLAMGRGRPRSAAELTVLVRAAGFSQVRALPPRMPVQTGVLVATRA